MLENMSVALSRIQAIKANFQSARAQGLVSIAPHGYAQPASESGPIRPFFPEHLMRAIGNNPDSVRLPATPAVTSAEPSSVETSSPKSSPAQPSRYDDLIEAAAAKHDLAPALVKAVIHGESGFRPNAVSNAGAQGLMQLMPGTSASLSVNDAFDPEANIEGGVRYLREQIDRFGDLSLALAAYNAGPGAVARYRGVPPFEETRNYINKVLTYREFYESGS